MKSRTLKLIVFFICKIAVILVLISCDNSAGSGDFGSFIYDGTTYQLHSGYLQVIKTMTDVYFIGFYAVSSGIDFEKETGKGHGLWIELYSPTELPVVGTYNYVVDLPGWMDPYTFDSMWIYINFNSETEEGEYHQVEDGTVTVFEVGDNTISLSFEVTLDDGKTATGSCSGAVTILPALD